MRSSPLPRLLAAIALLAVLLTPPAASADDEFTLYELLDPAAGTFAITFDVTTSRVGATTYLNTVRPGSEVSDERVLDRASGADLDWSLLTGSEAKARGLAPARVADDARFLAVSLAGPVPARGEARIRILKTYRDPASYRAEGDTVVFERSLGIRANAVVLPRGYELIACSVPAIVSTLDDGRVKASFLNDRDDSLDVRIVGRRLGGER